MEMRETRLRVPIADSELGADRLWGAGARAVEEVDVNERVVELRSVLADDDAVSRSRLGELQAGWEVSFVSVSTVTSAAWRDYAVPIDVSEHLTIAPAWKPLPDRTGLVVPIEPGAAFGLGDHPTTRLSAALLDEVLDEGKTVLDVGCGTGVLAIVAALRGASAVTGIDIADAAVEATEANATLNGVTVDASTTPLADVDGTYDVVVANILAPTLVSMAADLRRVLRGDLLISGVLAEAHGHVLEALRPLVAVETRVLDGWAAVHLRNVI